MNREYCSHIGNGVKCGRRSYFHCSGCSDKKRVFYCRNFEQDCFENHAIALLASNWLSLLPTPYLQRISSVSVFLVNNDGSPYWQLAVIMPPMTIRLKGGMI